MAQGQHLHPGADLDAPGSRGNGTGDRQRRGANRALGSDMKLGQPHRIEPPLFGCVDLRKRLGKGGLGGGTRRALKLVKHAELECHSRFSLSPHRRDREASLGLMMRRCQPGRCAARRIFRHPAASDAGLRAGPGRPPARRRLTSVAHRRLNQPPMVPGAECPRCSRRIRIRPASMRAKVGVRRRYREDRCRASAASVNPTGSGDGSAY